MRLEIAKTAGFCFGVRNAIRIAVEKAEEKQAKGIEGGIYTYGPLIHNAQAIADLESKGIVSVDSMDRFPIGTSVVIRAHGISEREEHILKALDLELLDATCPFVKKIHRIVAASEKRVMIFGDKDHPEVRGIRGWCQSEPVIFKDQKELHEALEQGWREPVLVVAQTTFDRYRFEEMVGILQEAGIDAEIRETICEATMQHQMEAVEIAGRSDLMVVIGGKHSSNTKKLAALCESHCAHTIFAETKEDILPEIREWFSGKDVCIGVTAGASTPDYVIEEAAKKLQTIFE